METMGANGKGTRVASALSLQFKTLIFFLVSLGHWLDDLWESFNESSGSNAARPKLTEALLQTLEMQSLLDTILEDPHEYLTVDYVDQGTVLGDLGFDLENLAYICSFFKPLQIN
ncbi:hypothetical protein Tco_0214083 [Tanacetum coccineum]